MLVLSRKHGEQIRIGDHIVITVQRLSGNRVSLGIEAPADCKIMRGELEEIPLEHRNAAGMDEPVEMIRRKRQPGNSHSRQKAS